MKSRVKPGTRAGIPNATEEQIRVGLAAWIISGTRRAGAAATKVAEQTVSKWRDEHPGIWREEAHAHAQAIRDARTANARATIDAKMLGVSRAQAMLEGGVDLTGTPLKPEHVAALTRMLNDVDTSEDRILRLDAGTPTEIQETRDATPDDQLRAEVEAMLRDPKTRAALAGQQP